MRIFARCLDLQCAKPSAERRTLSAAEAGHQREKKMSAVQTPKRPRIGRNGLGKIGGTDLRAAGAARVRGDFDIIADLSRRDHCPMPPVAQIRRQYEAAFANSCGERAASWRPPLRTPTF
jgi:hypothetical protein